MIHRVHNTNWCAFKRICKASTRFNKNQLFLIFFNVSLSFYVRRKCLFMFHIPYVLKINWEFTLVNPFPPFTESTWCRSKHFVSINIKSISNTEKITALIVQPEWNIGCKGQYPKGMSLQQIRSRNEQS